MTVAEMIEWLKTQDQSATVYVVSYKRNMLQVLLGWNEPSTVQTVLFDPSRHAEHTDSSHLSQDGQPATELLLGVFRV